MNAGSGDPGGGPVKGIDAARVSAWFAENIPGATPPLHFEPIAGGHSNLTYRVQDDAGHLYVLRRPPIGHLLPTAHDVGREHRIITAMAPAGIPVAPALELCVDPAVNDAPFSVTAFVDGLVVRTEPDAAALTIDARQAASGSLVDTLVAIHEVDPAAIGLGDLGRTDGYISRQLKRWYAQYVTSRDTQNGPDVADVDRVHELLVSRIPDQGRPGVVHGDYRLDNTIVAADGRVLAVLDWELCTLGDPLADLGQLLSYWASPAGDPTAPPGTAAPGFFSRAQVADRYAAVSGRDLSDLDFYVSFANWKLACILEGVYTRYAAGAMGDVVFDFHDYPLRIRQLAAESLELAARLG